ncbi:contact-dependent growth inhibition system immunity protein [Janibacter sp. CX7]|uniref:contact-dependent growth inhibition system immunity protein n=1 Tax=Janibacter sp. CX7 TaxID=2963431 RepID=UPI0020CC7F3C|nr:contact-dependent growth inhibition system immunity protein [Janibacter sp. CX7]UTT65226.1 contact-dependent growth inhibition system immunity protein [Janibacter sp. CX7]
MSLEEKYPALRNLMSAGFNQDFWDIDGSPEGVVSAFTHNPLFCARIPGEVERLLSEFRGEDLDDALTAMGNTYDYTEDGLTASQWLTAVADQVRSEVPDVAYVDVLWGRTITTVEWQGPVALVSDGVRVVFESGVSFYAADDGGTSGPGEAAPGLQRLVGESILTAYVADQRLRLGTANVALVSEPSEGAAGWRIELDPVTS